MRNSLSVIIVVLACVVFGFFAIPQKAQITLPISVGNTSDTVVAGACTQTGNPANCSLRGAIEQANVSSSNSIIRFAIPASDPFCSAGVCTINLTSALPAITEPVSIIGPGADKLRVRRNSGGNYRIFNVTTTGTVGISGITVSNGISGANGGGIFHGSGTLTITSCAISTNQSSGDGGGIYNSGGTLNVTNSTISGNSAFALNGVGGGIANVSGGTLNVTNSTLSGNFADHGGGIYNAGGVDISTSNIVNSTLNGNFSGFNGGAISNTGGILNVTNSTLTGNIITGLNPQSGGGIDNVGTTTANVRNSIIALNGAPSGPDVNGSFVSAGFNLIGKINGSTGFSQPTDLTGTNTVPLNPMIDPAGLQNNGGLTRTVALLPGSPAIDKGSSNGLTGPLTTDQRGTFRRTFNNTAIPNAAGGDGTDIGAFELQSRSLADFDGDNKTDIGIFRPVPAEWWINRSSTGATFATQFGATTDKLVPGDYTGDGKADIAFWRPSTGFWFVLRSEDFSFFSFPFGSNGDIPAPADYDGDGKTDAAVYRPSSATWFIRRSVDSETTILTFGANGDSPVPADYDGDGRADVAIFRPSVGQWWLNRSTAGVIATTFGNSSDKPAPGDYTGDGKSDIAFWRPSTGGWFVLRSEDFSFFSFPFGTVGDIPAPGDYDGDGRYDATVFRPSSATWFVQRSTAGTLIQQFGANGDRPVPNAFVP